MYLPHRGYTLLQLWWQRWRQVGMGWLWWSPLGSSSPLGTESWLMKWDSRNQDRISVQM